MFTLLVSVRKTSQSISSTVVFAVLVHLRLRLKGFWTVMKSLSQCEWPYSTPWLRARGGEVFVDRKDVNRGDLPHISYQRLARC
jgi:hypothetical protein